MRYNCYRAGGSVAKLFALKNNLPFNRICFTCAKLSRGKQPLKKKRDSAERRSSWNAVSRNRAKRLGREAYRLMKARLLVGYDLILLVYPEADKTKTQADFTFSDRAEQLESLFTKAGLLK